MARSFRPSRSRHSPHLPWACLSPVPARGDSIDTVLAPRAQVPTVSFLSLFYLENQ